MIKIDIVKGVAGKLNLKDKDALQIVDSIIESMKEVICEYGRLEVRDFGVFQVKERKERIGRNPRNKDEYPIPPRKVVTFKLGKELKDHSVEGLEEELVGEPAMSGKMALSGELAGTMESRAADAEPSAEMV